MLHNPPVGSYEHGFSALVNQLVVESDGCVAVPQGAVLGVDINRDLIEEEV